jgi:hypothetical protein
MHWTRMHNIPSCWLRSLVSSSILHLSSIYGSNLNPHKLHHLACSFLSQPLCISKKSQNVWLCTKNDAHVAKFYNPKLVQILVKKWIIWNCDSAREFNNIKFNPKNYLKGLQAWRWYLTCPSRGNQMWACLVEVHVGMTMGRPPC